MERERGRVKEKNFSQKEALDRIPQIPEIVTPPNPFIYRMMLLMEGFLKKFFSFPSNNSSLMFSSEFRESHEERMK